MHLTQEQIVLHCYGDADARDKQAIDQHLQGCGQCRAEYEEIRALLAEIPSQVPEPPAYFEQKLWLNLRDRLPEQRTPGWQWRFAPSKWAIAGAMTVLVVAAFVAGRFWAHPPEPPATVAQADPRRVVLAAVGDHLERSQMLLTELMNNSSTDSAGIANQQELARNLLDDNRIYRQSAQRAGDPEVAHVLDDLERVLVEVANAPPDLSASNVQEVRNRLRSQDLLFKLHVLGMRISRMEATPGVPSANQRL
jgi:hypothetical protein